jgi:glycosyltransferase involved in cell wall biosynthesis
MASDKIKLISVCMTTFNGSEYVEEQINSILGQLPNLDDELIISDDGSTDATVEIIRSIDDPRIKLYCSNYKNVIDNFEFVIGKAAGDVIFLSDQDDIWHGDKVKIYLDNLRDNDLVFSNVTVVNSIGVIIRNHLYELEKDKSGLIKNWLRNSCFGGTIAFDKIILEKVLPFPRNIEMHDSWILLVAELFYSVKYLSRPLLFYRRHGSNVSSASEKSLNSFKKKVIIRIRYFKYLFLLKMSS